MKRKCKMQSAKCKVSRKAGSRYLLNCGTGKAKSSKFLVLSFSFAFFILSFALRMAYAEPISSVDLINNAKEFDAQTIIYEGEAIGDIMIRGEYAWVNLNDGKNAIGIWLDKAKASEIIYSGSYKSKGDWLEVAGVFHQACLEHGGDLDIHAQFLRKIKSGYAVTQILNWKKINLAASLLFILLTLWILTQLKLK
ncbi:MAG: DNA-binding protein [Candidatus Omnitrophota bacterium]